MRQHLLTVESPERAMAAVRADRLRLPPRPARRRPAPPATRLGHHAPIRVAASTGKAIAELDGVDFAAARTEALGHIWAYSRRQRSWFRKLGASRVDHRSAVKIIVSRLQ
jgi:hypothetical protein